MTKLEHLILSLAQTWESTPGANGMLHVTVDTDGYLEAFSLDSDPNFKLVQFGKLASYLDRKENKDDRS